MSEELNQILAACNYEVSDGTRYMWDCYGKAAHIIEFDFGDHAAAEVVFSRETRKVFEVTVWYEDARTDAYRWIEPTVLSDYLAEAQERGVDPSKSSTGGFWQNVDSFSEIVSILTDIADEPDQEEDPYDDRFNLTLSDEAWSLISVAAKMKDMSIPDFISEAIDEKIKSMMASRKLV